MKQHRRMFLELVKKRSSKYRARPKSIIERKIDKMLDHKQVLLESVGDVTNHITVPYAVIGGHAVTFHGAPRMTEDIDIITKEEYVDSIVSSLGLSVRNDLSIGGVAASTPSGLEIDIIAPKYDWVDGLLADAENTKHGKVVSKPYLVLTKMWSSRGQDDTDIISILKNSTDEEKEKASILVKKHFPNMDEDIDQMIEIANLGMEF